MAAIIKQKGWRANLKLSFENRESRTILAHREHVGPLVVQKPFYPEGSVCHVYVIHPPGGVVGGDELFIGINNQEQAHTLITTPAANKFYRSAGAIAHLKQELKIKAGSCLEWLPQETILFDGSKADSTTLVQLEENAKFIGWEIICLGRPASGEQFTNGSFRQRIELWSQNKPLLIDRAMFEGGSDMLLAPWGLQNYSVSATMIAYPATKQVLQLTRECANNEGILFAASLIDNVLVCRCLAQQAEAVKSNFMKVWSAIRPNIVNKQACPPRIWAT